MSRPQRVKKKPVRYRVREPQPVEPDEPVESVASVESVIQTLNKLDEQKDIIAEQRKKYKTSSAFEKIMEKYDLPQANIKTTLLNFMSKYVLDKLNQPSDPFKELLSPIKSFLMTVYPNPNTLAGYLVTFINRFKENYNISGKVPKGHPLMSQVYDWLNDRDLTKFNMEKKKQKRKKDQADRTDKIPFSLSKIKSIIETTMNSTEMTEQFVFVALTTGFRSIDILVTGKYEKIKDKPNWIKITGFSKTTLRFDQEISIEKRLLFDVPFAKVDAAIKSIRLENSEMITKFQKKYTYVDSNRKITNSLNGRLNRQVRKLFGEDFTIHKMRHLYSLAHYALYGGDATEAYWIQSILGHSSANASISYAALKIVNDLVVDDKPKPTTTKPTTTKSKSKPDEKLVENVKRNTNDIVEIKSNPVLIPLEHPELKNKRALSAKDRLDNLEKLYKLSIKKHRELRKYGYGGDIISKYLKSKKN